MLALFCGFFRCFRLFGGFFEANWFLTLIAFDKKDNAIWSESFWSGENKLHHRKARVYETISSRSLVSRSFYSGPSVAILVPRAAILLASATDQELWQEPILQSANRGPPVNCAAARFRERGVWSENGGPKDY